MKWAGTPRDATPFAIPTINPVKYMRNFAEAWPDETFVQAVLAQITWYALRDTTKPIGVAEYRLTDALPPELKESLPTIEELESRLKQRAGGDEKPEE